MPSKKSLGDFQPKNQPVSRQIAEKIQKMVMDGELVPGDRLPSERQLAEDLNVSRNMIREATALLEERGIVSVQIGSGIYVVEASTDTVSRTFNLYAQRKKITVAQMFEVRWVLEVENARLAANNASPKNLEQLEETLAKMEANIDKLDIFAQEDIRFHRLLAIATQNPLFPVLIDTIQEMLYQQAKIATDQPSAAENALKHHRKIWQAVKAGDPVLAHSSMSDHLESAWDYLLRAVKDPQETIGEMGSSIS